MCYPRKRIIVALLLNTDSEVSVAGSSKQVTYDSANRAICVRTARAV